MTKITKLHITQPVYILIFGHHCFHTVYTDAMPKY